MAAAKLTSNYTIYGVLYIWSAAMAGAAGSSANPSKVKGVCPSGWHLPSNAEWTQLVNYLIANRYNYEGTTTDIKIAKSMAASSMWNTSSTIGAVGNNLSLNNSSGFSALPGGVRSSTGYFNLVGDYGNWWSSTEESDNNAWERYMVYIATSLSSDETNKSGGRSVRCVRD